MIENEGSTIIYPNGKPTNAHSNSTHMEKSDGYLQARLDPVIRPKASTYNNIAVVINGTNKISVVIVKSDDGIKILTDYPDI